MSRDAWCFAMVLGTGIFLGSFLTEVAHLPWPGLAIGVTMLLASMGGIHRADDRAWRERWKIQP